jgi:hypothetical protein
MSCKCVECGGKIDCDSIICTTCLAEIITKVNMKNQGEDNSLKTENRIEARSV